MTQHSPRHNHTIRITYLVIGILGATLLLTLLSIVGLLMLRVPVPDTLPSILLALVTALIGYLVPSPLTPQSNGA